MCEIGREYGATWKSLHMPTLLGFKILLLKHKYQLMWHNHLEVDQLSNFDPFKLCLRLATKLD